MFQLFPYGAPKLRLITGDNRRIITGYSTMLISIAVHAFIKPTCLHAAAITCA